MQRFSRPRLFVIAAIAALTAPVALSAFMPDKDEGKPLPKIEPQIPGANRETGGRVFLEHADLLNKESNDSFLVLTGNVRFSRGPMLMFCDSAHYFPETESMDAFGNVHMEQGDTLFVYADELNYDGREEIAVLYGEPVRMINRDVTLRTDRFIYDMKLELGYYTVGGELTDTKNRLTSLEGEYVPSTKEANFYTDVHLNSISEKDTLDIYTDTLYYNTDTHVAELSAPSRIVNAQATIFTRSGTYNTETEEATLFDRSLVRTNRGATLEGDTLFYDRTAGFGEAFGSMVLTDSIKQSTLSGDYGFFNEITDSAYVTGRALAMEYSRGDTLYMHGREIFSFRRIDTVEISPERIEADSISPDSVALRRIPPVLRPDTNQVIVCYPRVRFYRSDMQGLCDSMRFEQKDSTLHMFRHPIVWSGDRQIFGNIINLHLNDSTIDRATLPEFGFTAQHIEDDFYNQLSGKEMIAYFADDELSRLDINGNVEAIMLPQENDSTYNKILNAESSFLTATFKDQNILRLKMWPETSGTVTPLYLARKSLFFLPKFRWYTGLRPTSPDDIFVVPKEMDDLMAEP